ncbi:transmembrane protein 120 homolog isoform X2 [Teleopsis dalmanni]|uniref:transmembrane protein 120 homolog isoform X2 n=1 Tax=Teleopsis dalmanni TaxID=139649 RepID=UPI0018CF1EF1|nr:transmembrane protein 120 homolog isoform X2 [Teleopsis dalmanni]
MSIDALSNEWDELGKEFVELENCNRKYIELLEQLYSHQQKCFNEIKHQRYRINQINASLKHIDTEPIHKLLLSLPLLISCFFYQFTKTK